MLIKKILVLSIVLMQLTLCYSQKYFSRTGEISFHASTPLETIDPVSNSALTVLDFETGKIQWSVLVKSFVFHKALMQEHFNENYMESSKIPKAKFTGTLNGIESIDINKDGIYELSAVGKLEIHGVERDIETEVTFEVVNRKLSASSTLQVATEDFDIEIPSVVKDKIAKEITINVKASYDLLKK